MRIFAEMVESELSRAREKHARINSLHEGYAVILEELDELWNLVKVKVKRENRNLESVLEELIQIAAMAQRTAEDLVLCVYCDGRGGYVRDRGNGDADSVECTYCGGSGLRECLN